MTEQKHTPGRKRRNHLAIVEAHLFAIERFARVMADDSAEPTPTDMHGILVEARGALRAMGHDYPHPVRGALTEAGGE
jgi:hypothetical protein